MRIRKFMKKAMAIALAAVTVVSATPVTSMAATGDAKTITFTQTYDSDGNEIKYNSGATIDGHYAGGKGESRYRIDVDGKTAFCIEPGVSLHTGDALKEASSKAWKDLSSNKKKAIKLALLYGYQGNKKNLKGNDDEKWVATQTLVWEFMAGSRKATGTFKRNNKTVYNLHFGSNYPNKGAEAVYDQIVDLLKTHNTIPSFMSENKSEIVKGMKYADGKYSVTLTDKNEILSEFTITSESDKVSVSQSGNKLTISSTEAIEDSVRIKAVKNTVPTVSKSATLIAYGADNLQDVVTGVANVSDVVAYINVQTKPGNLALKKTSEDGVVAGITFTVSGEGIEQTVTTGADGTITIENLDPGIYTVTEALYDPYVPQESKTVTVVGGKTAEVSFSNILKKFNVSVSKKDADTMIPQGDASLAGAVYGIYKDGVLVDQYTTDSNGQFTTKYYVFGTGWTLKEITPPEGYLLDDTVYPVGSEPKHYPVEYNVIATDVFEDAEKGNIAIIKHTDNGETKIETPEEGATFEVYLKSAGSYSAAKEYERDILVCDKYGFAQTKQLPYGTYTVHQTSGWEGCELVADFDVFVCENGETYRYLINNGSFESHVKVVKKDAETGKTIPYAGAGFQIYDPEGNLVTMTFTYPEVTTIDTFYTSDDGSLVTPESLPYGKGYQLVEVQAPYGYVVDSEPVTFDVVQENAEKEEEVTIIKVERFDVPQKGKIIVSKTGEVFQSVSETEGIYQPVFAEDNLEGAEFEITAAEDIVTPDGTVRVEKGEVVDTITTDEDGMAVSKELYLGNYEMEEIAAPEGMVLSDEVHKIELAYAGQEVEVTENVLNIVNERQRVKIDLVKYMEVNELYEIGANNEIAEVRFGLFAEEELKANDGSVIPADGLIEVISVQADGTATAKSDLPFGSYYVQEMATNAAYQISDEQYPVEFEYAGQNIETVHIKVNDGEAIENDIIYGSVSGIKLGEDGDGLGGAVIGLFKSGTEEFTEETAKAVTTSAIDGSFAFSDVPYGTWVIKEIASPEGFVLSEEVIPVTIGAVAEVVEIQLTNYYIKGNVELKKVDKEKTKKKLSGAVFEIYEDTNGNGEYDKDDVLVGEMTESKKGIYRMDDLRYGSYFVHEKKAPKGYKKDDGYYLFSITENGQTVTVENEKGVGFTNEKVPVPDVPQTGDSSMTGFWIGLGAIAVGGLISVVIMKKKKDEDYE